MDWSNIESASSFVSLSNNGDGDGSSNSSDSHQKLSERNKEFGVIMTSTAGTVAIMKNDNEQQQQQQQPTPTKSLSSVGSSNALQPQPQSPRKIVSNVPSTGTYVSTGPIEVSKALQDGEKFVKWDDESTSGTPVTMRVDAKGFYLCWVDQNNELDILDIATIRDVRTGPFAKKPRVSILAFARPFCVWRSSNIN